MVVLSVFLANVRLFYQLAVEIWGEDIAGVSHHASVMHFFEDCDAVQLFLLEEALRAARPGVIRIRHIFLPLDFAFHEQFWVGLVLGYFSIQLRHFYIVGRFLYLRMVKRVNYCQTEQFMLRRLIKDVSLRWLERSDRVLNLFRLHI